MTKIPGFFPFFPLRPQFTMFEYFFPLAEKTEHCGGGEFVKELVFSEAVVGISTVGSAPQSEGFLRTGHAENLSDNFFILLSLFVKPESNFRFIQTNRKTFIEVPFPRNHWMI